MVIKKDVIAVFDQELDGLIFHLGVCHFAGDGFGTHNRGRENNGDVERCHL